jgi:hypothetical protein
MAANEAVDEQKPEAYPLGGYVEDFLRLETEVGGQFQKPLFGDRDELPYPRSETARVPALNVYESRPSEPADKPFA